MKRLRLLAGPNGSGKSTILEKLKARGYSAGITVNADEIEAGLKMNGWVDLSTFGIPPTDLIDFETLGQIGEVASYLNKIGYNEIYDLIEQRDGRLIPIAKEIDSYVAAIIATLIRYHLVQNGLSINFETVLSHPSKLEYLQFCVKKGYRIYLYFVCLFILTRT